MCDCQLIKLIKCPAHMHRYHATVCYHETVRLPCDILAVTTYGYPETVSPTQTAALTMRPSPFLSHVARSSFSSKAVSCMPISSRTECSSWSSQSSSASERATECSCSNLPLLPSRALSASTSQPYFLSPQNLSRSFHIFSPLPSLSLYPVVPSSSHSWRLGAYVPSLSSKFLPFDLTMKMTHFRVSLTCCRNKPPLGRRDAALSWLCSLCWTHAAPCPRSAPRVGKRDMPAVQTCMSMVPERSRS